MTSVIEPIAPPSSIAVRRRAVRPKAPEISLTAVLTASIWMACMTIGIVGIVIPYARPQPPKPAPPPIQAQLLDVVLTTDATDAIAPEDAAPPPQNTLT